MYDLETTYLEETRDFGNIFTGWELYSEGQKGKSKKAIQNEERHFSLSSVTSPASRKEENKKVILVILSLHLHWSILLTLFFFFFLTNE
ncbi:hypothetical protein EON65_23940 [archaeon]|nr:MAG: hypothetical protein EON65_23940 [archaeon]